jgi:hypothetical protein
MDGGDLREIVMHHTYQGRTAGRSRLPAHQNRRGGWWRGCRPERAKACATRRRAGAAVDCWGRNVGALAGRYVARAVGGVAVRGRDGWQRQGEERRRLLFVSLSVACCQAAPSRRTRHETENPDWQSHSTSPGFFVRVASHGLSANPHWARIGQSTRRRLQFVKLSPAILHSSGAVALSSPAVKMNSRTGIHGPEPM